MLVLEAQTDPRHKVIAACFALCDKFKENLNDDDALFVHQMRLMPPELMTEDNFFRLKRIANEISITGR
jgi:hypothetical protein